MNIMKITDLNLIFFCNGANPRMKFLTKLKYYRFKIIFIDRNCLLSIIIDRNCLLLILSMRKIIDFSPSVWKVGVDHGVDLGYFFLGKRAHSSPRVYHTLSNHNEFLLGVQGSQMYLKHISIKTWNFIFLRLPTIFHCTAKLSDIGNVFLERITYSMYKKLRYKSQFWTNFLEIHKVGAGLVMGEPYSFWKQSTNRSTGIGRNVPPKPVFRV